MNEVKSTGNIWVVLGWVSVLIAFLLSWTSWIVPVSWYGFRDWLFPLLILPFVAIAGYAAYKTRSVALAIMAVVSLFFPVIIIVVSMMIWGA